MSCIEYLLFLVAIVAIAYWYLKRVHSHWEKQNVPSIPNPIPLFGHMWRIISVKENIIEFADRVYRNYDSSIVGFFFMQQPAVIVRDPDLVKTILQTNFSSFQDNVISLHEKCDPLLAKNPFFTRDHVLWKMRRNKASANLTGKKLKYLSVIIQEVSKKMIAFLERKIEENNGCYECELKGNFLKYTGEVVANGALAVEGQSFEANPAPLSFAELAVTLQQVSLINGFIQSLIFYIPSVANLFGINFMNKKTESYMRENLKSILKERQQTNNTPNDFLHFCMETNSDLEDILADVANFYVDVYETSSSLLANTIYCLSKNPEVQTKLRDHIVCAIKENEGSITYESLKNMPYLDQVVQESLRHFAPIAVLIKVCTNPISLIGSDGLNCYLKPGNVVVIPVNSLHHDQKYWSYPELFNPDRFSEENQINNKSYTFLGFGEGPRSCIGMRLGLLLVKQAVASLLLNFSVESSSKTKIPLEIEPSLLLQGFKGGLWGKFKKLH